MSQLNLPKSVRKVTQVGPEGEDTIFAVLPKSVRKIVVADANGGETFYARKRKKRRVSRRLRKSERQTRHTLAGLHEAIGELLRRNDESNARKKNGWIKDQNKNGRKAWKKSRKHFRKAMEA